MSGRHPACLAIILLVAGTCASARAQETEEIWKSSLSRAVALESSRDYTRAEVAFQQALHEAERFGADDTRVATTLASMGANYRQLKKFAEAETAWRRALAIVEKQSKEDSPEIADATFNVATAMVDQGHQVAAMAMILKVVGIYQTNFGGFSAKTASARCLLGEAYRLSRRLPEAERELRQCADVRESNGGLQDPAFADALHSLALAYMDDGKLALAEPRFTMAEKIREKTLGITSPLLAETMEDHAKLLRRLGRDVEATRLTSMAAAIRRSAASK